MLVPKPGEHVKPQPSWPHKPRSSGDSLRPLINSGFFSSVPHKDRWLQHHYRPQVEGVTHEKVTVLWTSRPRREKNGFCFPVALHFCFGPFLGYRLVILEIQGREQQMRDGRMDR